MPADDKPKAHRLGDVHPDWLTTGARKPEPENPPDAEVEAPWEEPAKPPSKRSRLWSLSWVNVVLVCTLIAVAIIAIRIGTAPPQVEPAPAPSGLSEAELGAAAEQTVLEFFAATSIEERACMILAPERLRSALEECYSR